MGRAMAAVSAASYPRVELARSWVARRAPAEEVLVIAATLDAASEILRGAAVDVGAAFGWHRLSFAQLTAMLAAPLLAERGLVPLSSLGIKAVVTRLVHELRRGGDLGRFREVAGTPGFPRAIANVIAELRLAALDANRIETVSPDLTALTVAYEKELAALGFADWPTMIRTATEAVVRGPAPGRLAGLPSLLLDVPVRNEAEFALLRALAEQAPEVLITIPAADRGTLSYLRDRLAAVVDDLDAVRPGNRHGSTSLQRLQSRLFREEAVPPLDQEADGALEIFSAPGEGREAVEIARRVLAQAREGVPFDRMAVLLRAPEAYRSFLNEAFARARIPVHFARGAVRPDPAGRAFVALLRCAAEGLSARRFAEYLSLGQVPDADVGGTPPEATPADVRWTPPDIETSSAWGNGAYETEASPAGKPQAPPPADDGPVRVGQLRSPRRWERLIVDATVIGGRDRWRRRIDGLANELRLGLAEVADEDEARAGSLQRALEDLDVFRTYALPLIDDLDSLPKAADWGAWLDRLGALATRALRQPDRVLALLSELAPLAPVGPVTLRDVLLTLEDTLLEAAVPPSPSRYGKVFVGPIEAARGLTFDTVFVPGIAEKMFPKKIVEEPILLDALRREIDEALATNQTRIDNERLALALAAGAAERRLFLSYPRLELETARPRVPSFYALEAVRAATGRLPDFAELAGRAETATTARLGWPAPPEATEAIDDAEHDLAILGGIVGRVGESPGAARYLLGANPHLARALRFRHQRWSRSWTTADGMTGRSDAARAVLTHHTLGARAYSPTALENYAACPYRFFLQAIQGLAPREVPEAIDELDPLSRGSLIHDIQFELFGRLRDTGLLPLRPANLETAGHILDEVMAAIGARYRDELAPAIERIWDDAIAGIRADLREWLRRASEDASGYVPVHFELSFGLAHRQERRHADPRSFANLVDLDSGIQLRGSIDLVERHPGGDIRVTDHKTGKASITRGQRIGGGVSLQPILYALAAEKLFAGDGSVSSGRLYFCTSNGGFTEHAVPLDDRSRNAAITVAQTIGEAINGPFLPAAPAERTSTRPQACQHCDYRIVCGPHEERRTGLKSRERLAPLLDLRTRP